MRSRARRYRRPAADARAASPSRSSRPPALCSGRLPHRPRQRAAAGELRRRAATRLVHPANATASYPILVALLMLLLLAGASVAALALVLREHEWSLAALVGQPAAAFRREADRPTTWRPRIARRIPPPLSERRSTGDAARNSGIRRHARPVGDAAHLANLTALVAEDGLLLSGLFGEGYRKLQLTDPQQESVASVVARLKANEQGLKDKSVTLEQWYAESRKAGDELLAVLTDPQKQQLQILLERGELTRLHLVDYSARIRPELAVAQMPWSVPTEGRPFHAVPQSPLAVADQ